MMQPNWPVYPLTPTQRWLILLLWMAALAMVLFGSLEPRLAPPERWHLDKLVHGGTYALLAWLPALALNGRRAAVVGAIAVILFGGAIEIAQDHVPGRTGSFGDFALDVVGAVLGLALGLATQSFLGRRPRAAGAAPP